MTKHNELVAVRVNPQANGQPSLAEVLSHTFSELRDELVSTLMYVLGNREDAKDAAQDSFVKCWNARDQLGQVVNLRAWIFRVALNTAKDLQRSACHRKARPLMGEATMLTDSASAPFQSLEDKESTDRLRQAITTLRQEEKEVFLLRQNGELTYEQIAELRQSPVGTVKTQMRSALQKLRKVLA